MAFFSDDGDFHLDDNLLEYWGALHNSCELDAFATMYLPATDVLSKRAREHYQVADTAQYTHAVSILLLLSLFVAGT